MEIEDRRIARYNLTSGTRYSPAEKQAAIELRKQGYSCAQICATLDIGATNKTLRRWFKAAGLYDLEFDED